MIENKLDRLLKLQYKIGRNGCMHREEWKEFESLKSEIQQAIDENQKLKEERDWYAYDYERLKEKLEKIEKISEELIRTDYGYWTLELLHEKIQQILDE